MNVDDITRYFTHADGSYHFARWARPMSPVIFGVDDQTLATFKGAVGAVAGLAGIGLAEVDHELGSNLMVFFCQDWDELNGVPDLDKLIPDLAPLTTKLIKSNANQYRIFRFDDDGAIKACFILLRVAGALADVPADRFSIVQMVQAALLWSEDAFDGQQILIQADDGTVVLRPDIGALIQAAYDPRMPSVADDASHAHRLAARVQMAMKGDA